MKECLAWNYLIGKILREGRLKLVMDGANLSRVEMGTVERHDIYKQGEMEEDIEYSGRFVLVRWSCKKEMFGSCEGVVRALERRFGFRDQLKGYFGGRVRVPLGFDGDVEEEYLFFLHLTRAKKVFRKDVDVLILHPQVGEWELGAARENCQISFGIFGSSRGIKYYASVGRDWIWQIEAECSVPEDKTGLIGDISSVVSEENVSSLFGMEALNVGRVADGNVMDEMGSSRSNGETGSMVETGESERSTIRDEVLRLVGDEGLYDVNRELSENELGVMQKLARWGMLLERVNLLLCRREQGG